MALTKVSRGLLSTSIVDNGNATAITIDSSENVLVGTTFASGAGGTTIDANGGFSSILTSGAGGNTLISAISGVSNGYQISVDTSNNQTYKWHNGGSQSMTLNSSGNLGIGTTSPDRSLHVYESNTPTLATFQNDGGEALVKLQSANNSQGIIEFGDPQDGNQGRLVYNHSGSYMSMWTADSERMRIDSSGNLLKRNNGNIEVGGFGNGTDYGVILTPADGSGYWHMYNDAGGHLAFGNSNTIGSTERMRIDSSGNLLVNSTTTSTTTKFQATGASAAFAGAFINSAGSAAYGVAVSSGTGEAMYFYNGGTVGTPIGRVRTNSTTCFFENLSDQRLKENIEDADDAGSRIDALQVRKFDWKVDGSHQDYGMVAQELQAVAPEAVSPALNPEDMMGVDYSKLVPMLIKEIQSLRNRVAQLEE